MKLLIISNMAHYYKDGVLVGHGPTVREINYLAQLFDEVDHLACLHTANTMDIGLALPYDSEKIHLISVPPAGGPRIIDKVSIFRLLPLYIKEVLCALPNADVVHIRCPSNISLLAILLLAFLKKPSRRWIKYAGNWKGNNDAWSYQLQRWWLTRGFTRGVVTVNGQWEHDPDHVHAFYNPSLTSTDLEAGRRAADKKQLTLPLRLIYVGRLDERKGVGRALEIVAQLKTDDVLFDIIGDGKERSEFEKKAVDLGIENLVTFHGNLPITKLGNYYACAHLMLLPTNSSEGWPKVLSEGMAYGVVPIAGNVSSISQYLTNFASGQVLDPFDLQAFVNAILWYRDHPAGWRQQVENGLKVAHHFTYDYYLAAVRKVLEI